MSGGPAAPGTVPRQRRRLAEDGWLLAETKGSHRQFKHPVKPGRVTVPGRPGDELGPGTLRSIYRQAGWNS
ncbi:MAG: type II toxin-antitoxin system HicA family toxin [Candidatus Eremiobacteraeota bacterium]|nr:type II toxin-antitoxin system HicA family toxin [Candidatus Eremiobacteraeota bacterium]MBC5803797.1 type II toxin-antitoxin system HicA family toxin [Candidatus Eremiobacteraeota bacterium]MBC5825852.1 type II toxin-antitoxin system HicA family toxin [Candidatus Eremiobacteraeota bacterium]